MMLHLIRAIFFILLAAIIIIIDLARDFIERQCYGTLQNQHEARHEVTAVEARNMAKYRVEFAQLFPSVMAKLVDEKRDLLVCLKSAYDHLGKAARYNVLGGKMTRGLMVVSTLSRLYGDRPLSASKRRYAYIVGWCIEFLQASHWIDIDIIDDSTKRNSKLCWHKKENVGMMAVNDSSWLISLAYDLLNDEFRNHPCYTDIVGLLHMRPWWDCYASENNTDICHFTVERLQAVIRYRTTYFSYYLPIATALYMAGVKREVVNGPVLNILLAIGEFYHNQDDFHGWFDSHGKVNMNIRNNRCTWLIVEALRKANTEQKEILKANYGRPDEGCVERVKAVYESLNLLKSFMEYEEQSYQHVKMLIDKHREILPTRIFHELNDKIYFGRTKYFYVRIVFAT